MRWQWWYWEMYTTKRKMPGEEVWCSWLYYHKGFEQKMKSMFSFYYLEILFCSSVNWNLFTHFFLFSLPLPLLLPLSHLDISNSCILLICPDKIVSSWKGKGNAWPVFTMFAGRNMNIKALGWLLAGRAWLFCFESPP